MKTNWTPTSLAAFERDIANEFNAGKIKAPIHLAGGNEQQLIELFQKIHDEDWICTAWRSHYHCLLKGVPAEEVKSEILAGRSITLCFPDYNIISSALVGGIMPIAVGLALAEQKNLGKRVWCFIGDMTACSGIAHEALQYARGHDLPLNLVIEDNGKSVATDTLKSWGLDEPSSDGLEVIMLKYDLLWPHVGTGTWVSM